MQEVGKIRYQERVSNFREMTVEQFCGWVGIETEELLLMLVTRQNEGSPVSGSVKMEASRGGAMSMMSDSAQKVYTEVNTRTGEGRDEYDSHVLQCIREGGTFTTANQVRTTCGGNADQARKSLNRLIDSGQVAYEGRARGTKYYIKED